MVVSCMVCSYSVEKGLLIPNPRTLRNSYYVERYVVVAVSTMDPFFITFYEPRLTPDWYSKKTACLSMILCLHLYSIKRCLNILLKNVLNLNNLLKNYLITHHTKIMY